VTAVPPVPHRLEITSRSGSQVVAVEGDRILLGTGDGAAIRLPAEAGAGPGLWLVRTDRGYRLEPAAAGATVVVGGEALFCKDLEPGDSFAAGAVQLRWLGAPAALRARPVPQAGGDAVRPVAVAPARARPSGAVAARARPRLVGLPLFVAALVVFLVAFLFFTGPGLGLSPRRSIELARQQLAAHAPEQALETLEPALRGARGDTLEEARRLEAELRERLAERADLAQVDAAKRAHEQLVGFADRYLRDGATRPAARELLRRCAEWTGEFGAACARRPEGRDLLTTVTDLRDRHAAIAATGEPDQAEDVRFAVQVHLSFPFPEHLAALRRYDEYLRAHPGDEAVRAERDAMLAAGEAWLRGRLQGVDTMLDGGDTFHARGELDRIERWSLLPQWAELVRPRRARLDAAK